MAGRHFIDGGGFSGYVETPPKTKLEIDLSILLPEEVALKLAVMSHQQGKTLNDMCVSILRSHLDGIVAPEECPHNEREPIKAGSFYCKDCGRITRQQEEKDNEDR